MAIARTAPPAKLNLFLEIAAKRDDGFHEIDTVMVAVDWCDELVIETQPDPGIELSMDWLPSTAAIATDLGLDVSSGKPKVLDIPVDESNLVTRALRAFQKKFSITSGFRVSIGKRIPSGAGMGGASSDAAHAIRCAAHLHQIAHLTDELEEVAAQIGSDVPFFLLGSAQEEGSYFAARARGRGERLSPIVHHSPVHFIVAFPNESLSTADVYRHLKVPECPVEATEFISAFCNGKRDQWTQRMTNRLSEPALDIMPRLGDLIECLWQSGLEPCQLTGSGSACFGIAHNSEQAQAVLERLKVELQPGVLLQTVQIVAPASPILIEPS